MNMVAKAARLTAIEAEQALLGAIIVNGATIDKIRGEVQSSDFSEAAHRAIFEAAVDRRDKGLAGDVLLLSRAIGDVDLGANLTAPAYIARLAASSTTIANAKSYAKEVRRCAGARELQAIASEIAAAAEKPSAVPSEIAGTAISALDALARLTSVSSSASMSMAEAADDVMAEVARIRAGGAREGVPSGFPSLDRLMGGFTPGHLVILAGRPSMGKTALAISLSQNVAKPGSGALYFSLEMSSRELGERALSALAFGEGDPLTYAKIREARSLTDSDMVRLARARQEMDRHPLLFEDQPAVTLGQIAARARLKKSTLERAGHRLRLVVVDHLGLVKPSSRYAGNKTNEIGELTSSLKALAKEIGCSVLALSQLNRAVESRDDKRPQIADLRDSGSIEQDADVVLLPFRQSYYLEKKANLSPEEEQRLLDCQMEMKVEVAKSRQGRTGRVKLFASMPCNFIAEREFR